MLAVDTNILLRIGLEDDSSQMKIVQKFLHEASEDHQIYVPYSVILEIGWVLKTKRFSRAEATAAIRTLLDMPILVIGQRHLVEKALLFYSKGKADFADYLAYAESLAHKADGLITFDKAILAELSCAYHPSDWDAA